jgi:hypothetical protein
MVDKTLLSIGPFVRLQPQMTNPDHLIGCNVAEKGPETKTPPLNIIIIIIIIINDILGPQILLCFTQILVKNYRKFEIFKNFPI